MPRTLEELRESLRERRPATVDGPIHGKHIDMMIIDDVMDYSYLTPPPVVAEALKSKRVTVYKMYDSDGELRDILCPELPEGDCRPGLGDSRCGGCDTCMLMQAEHYDQGRAKADRMPIVQAYAWVPENAKSLWR